MTNTLKQPQDIILRPYPLSARCPHSPDPQPLMDCAGNCNGIYAQDADNAVWLDGQAYCQNCYTRRRRELLNQCLQENYSDRCIEDVLETDGFFKKGIEEDVYA
jgi:hypothetical protein